MFSAIAATRAGRTRRGHALVGRDQLGQRRDRQVRVVAQRGGARLVDEHQQVRRRAVQQAERHARVGGVEQPALALHEQQVAALGALEHQPLARAGHVVGDHVVDRDPPAGDRNAGLPGRHVDRAQAAIAGRPVQLERHDLLADHRVGADAVDHLHGVRTRERPLGHGQVRGRGAQVAQRDPRARGGRGAARRPRRAGCAARPRRAARRRSPRAGRPARPGRACRRSAPPRSAARSRPARSPRASVATIGTGCSENGTTSTAVRPVWVESITATTSRVP